MNSGKSKLSRKTREPYGKVTEVGQVPIALLEISEIASGINPSDGPISLQIKAKSVKNLADSILAITCANPGCLSQMADSREHGYGQISDGHNQEVQSDE